MLRALVPNPTRLAQRLVDHNVTDPTVVRMYVREAMADPDPAALKKLYRDAYHAGAVAARALVDLAKTDDDEVDADPTTLDALLASGDEIWSDIASWTSDRVATVVTTQLTAGGSTVRSIAKAINDVVDDPERAAVIAQTETTRAMTDAAMATYQRFGADRIEFLATDDERTCPLCIGNEDQGPIPVTSKFENGMPPCHPRCRCTCVPAE